MEKIILFYKYVSIEDPYALMAWQRELCDPLLLKGRIILAHEGINGTLGGDSRALEQYIATMEVHPLFGNIDFKEAPGSATYFPRLQIKVKKEIVHLGVSPHKASLEKSGVLLTPTQAHELLQAKPDNLIVLDGRNNYESRIGRFEGAICPDIQNFRDLPVYIDTHINQFKDKQVLMYCTGGIRCERASAYLNTKGLAAAVYQIEGGIHRYVEEYPDGFFKGKNYVFDQRVAVPVTTDVLTICDICSTICDAYNHCLRAACNKQYVGCAACVSLLKNTCSSDCYTAIYCYHEPMRPAFKRADETAQL